MLYPRIIPCLLVRDKGLVKTVRFSDHKYVGDPINAVRIFNEKESDELIVLDIEATVKEAVPDYRMIANLAAECRMPLCYGGGIKTAEQAKAIIRIGVEKIAISSAAISKPSLITAIAEEIGSQSVVIVLDVKKNSFGGYELMTHSGRVRTGKNLFDFAREAESRGAGEIVLNSIDNDGVMKGYDIAAAKKLRAMISIPMTILGGAGSIRDIGNLIQNFGIVGAAAGSLFVFKGPYKAVLISYPTVAEKETIVRENFRTV
jgi:cyclase